MVGKLVENCRKSLRIVKMVENWSKMVKNSIENGQKTDMVRAESGQKFGWEHHQNELKIGKNSQKYLKMIENGPK
jgi:hypothetical protein